MATAVCIAVILFLLFWLLLAVWGSSNEHVDADWQVLHFTYFTYMARVNRAPTEGANRLMGQSHSQQQMPYIQQLLQTHCANRRAKERHKPTSLRMHYNPPRSLAGSQPWPHDSIHSNNKTGADSALLKPCNNKIGADRCQPHFRQTHRFAVQLGKFHSSSAMTCSKHSVL
jgi:hypothetical protein